MYNTAVKNLIYSHPLINDACGGIVRILTIGYDEYSRAFIDECLMAVQLPEYSLDITVVSACPTDSYADYIRGRDTLANFVNINHSLEGSIEESYGNIDFIGENAISLKSEFIDRYNYIFISAGTDENNFEKAKQIACFAADNCKVCFVTRSSAETECGNIIPVRVDENSAADNELMRMAFNIFLVWNNKMGVNEAKEQFRNDYDKSSSLLFALSVKYKLISIGINPDGADAAEIFSKMIKSDKNLLGTLSAYEHRRWIIEKLLDGWTQPLRDDGTIDYESIIRNCAVRNEKEKTHICITRCGDDVTALAEFPKEKWDDEKDNTVNSFDELDKISVMLHRTFRRHSQQQIFSPETELNEVYKLFFINDIPLVSYNQLILCLKNILNGCYGYSVQYDYYEAAVKNAAEGLEVDKRALLDSELIKIRQKYYSKIQANLYKNYKLNNVKLIEQIPFILTYRVQPSMTMALDIGGENPEKNDAAFENAASATVINPSCIVYTYYFDENSQTGLIAEKLQALSNYFESRRIGCKIKFVATVSGSVSEKKVTGLDKRLKGLNKKEFIEKYVLIRCTDESDAVGKIIEALVSESVELYDGTTLLFRSAVSNLNYIEKIYSQFSYFEFKSEKKEFINIRGCEYLKYIDNSVYFRINDMFSLKRATDTKFTTPDYAGDYEKLWDIYCGDYLKGQDSFRRGVYSWNILCDILSDYTLQNDKVISGRLTPCQRYEDTVYFPSYSRDAAFVLLEKLYGANIIETCSAVTMYTSDTCRMKIISSYTDISVMAEGFLNDAKATADYSGIYIETFGNRISLCSGKLDVSDLQLNTNNARDIKELLKQLAENHYISSPIENENKLSFSFTSKRMREILTSAGMILEVYTYYEALKTGYFDDIASGYEFTWSRDNVRNELDGVITKGFRSIIIECKARKQLDQNFYHKLYSIAEQFGINAKVVLIANTYDKLFVNQNNEQIQRGQMMDIVTVSKREDIENIGETLIKIIEDKFV